MGTHLGANTVQSTTRFLKLDLEQAVNALVHGYDTAVIEGRDFKIISVQHSSVLLKGWLFGREQMVYASIDAIDDIKRGEDVAA